MKLHNANCDTQIITFKLDKANYVIEITVYYLHNFDIILIRVRKKVLMFQNRKGKI